ncbi:MAG: M48 family metalloprotease [Bacteroidaceae bacterium]|nr:M48 family metalloprotease [Bacteroidaceae bacterium]
MEILKKNYLSLSEFIQKEMRDFPNFIQPPLYATDQEKQFSDVLIEFNKQQPGYLKYIVHTENMRRIAALRRLLGKDQVNASNNPQLFNVITKLCKGLGVNMPIVFTYGNRDIAAITDVMSSGGACELFVENNAFTLGTKDSLYIFVSEELINSTQLNENELLVLIAHEVGHAMANHSLRTLTYQSNFIQYIVDIDAKNKIKKMMSDKSFSRLQEVTADRAALIACRNVDYVCSMLDKLGKVHPELMDYDDSESDHPNNRKRIEMIRLFAKSQLYAECIERIDGFPVDKSRYIYTESDLQVHIMRII